MGKIVEIATCDQKGKPILINASAVVTKAKGVGDDYRGARENKLDRQVSIITQESWNAVCKELNSKLHWTLRQANIIVEGIDLKETKGEFLKLGGCIVEITGELTPGNKMNETFAGLKDALKPEWRGGVAAKVIVEGLIHEKDEVKFMERV